MLVCGACSTYDADRVPLLPAPAGTGTTPAVRAASATALLPGRTPVTPGAALVPLTPAGRPRCLVRARTLSLRVAPSTTADVLLRLEEGDEVLPVGRSADGRFFSVITSDGLEGWVSSLGLACPPDVPTAIPIHTPTTEPATPTTGPVAPSSPLPERTKLPGATEGCRVAMSGLELRVGATALARVILTLEQGEPLAALGRSSDGQWIAVRTQDAIEGWVSVAGVTCSSQTLAGLVVIAATATPTTAITKAMATPTPAAPPLASPTPPPSPEPVPPTPLVFRDWRGDYYDNATLAGAPALVRDDRFLSFDWAQGAPDSRLPADYFSARWTRRLAFEAGDYVFRLSADDGARLYVDDRLVVDLWAGGPLRTQSGQANLETGDHMLRVEYFELGGTATVALIWELVTRYDGWRGEYYRNPTLSGSPTIVRGDSDVHFYFGQGAPDSRIPTDGFSVRWTRELDWEGGTYRFQVRVDDGVRIWIDGTLILDEWHAADTTHQRDVAIAAGRHQLRVEYLELGGSALIQLDWERLAQTPMPPRPSS